MQTSLRFLIIFLFTFSYTVSGIGQSGLVAEYYDGQNFENKVATTIEPAIDHYWDRTTPIEGMNPHVCSVRWTGQLEAPETGKYTFSAKVDDGIRVWIGDQLVIDDWQLNDMGRFEGTAKMQAGQKYDLKVEYFNAMNEAEITLFWEIPDKERSWFSRMFEEKKEVISASYFYLPVDYKEIAVQLPPAPPVEEKIADAAPKPKKIAQKKEVKKTVAPLEAPEEIVEELTKETYAKYTPKNIAFDRAKSNILKESFQELDDLAAFLKRNPTLHLTIEGHTDNVGNKIKNQELSQKRAYAVAAYLVKQAIPADRIDAKGYGGSRPIVDTKDGKYHPQNRRVEFIMTDTAVANR